jgi:hypothetical protein
VKEAEIEWLYRSRRIPEEVFCRIPGKELEPAPEPGEIMVFPAHFKRGFGLLASDFFRRFLDFYELQPHHLPGNTIFFFLPTFLLWKVLSAFFLLPTPLLASTIFGSTRSRRRSFRSPSLSFSAGHV